MNGNGVKLGMMVKVDKLQQSTIGLLVAEKHLTCRTKGAVGTVLTWVPEHGGDVWFVRHHEDNVVAAYCYDELEPLSDVEIQQQQVAIALKVLKKVKQLTDVTESLSQEHRKWALEVTEAVNSLEQVSKTLKQAEAK